MNILNRARLPFVALALSALLAGLWAGLIRIGWQWPLLQPRLPSLHGALMISGFLGTLIGLERAVALSAFGAGARRRWTYLAPLLTGVGGFALLIGLPDALGRGLIAFGSVGLMMVSALIIRLHTTWDTIALGFGAALWLIGNVLWWSGQSVARVAIWWVGFLVLTIAGERLELARVWLQGPRASIVFRASAGLFLAGLPMSLVDFNVGVRICGAGLIALGGWLLRYDVARRTIRQAGLTRFIAACLLPGYGWIVFGGGLWLFGNFASGLVYDAALHSVLLGFVVSMIFGHAPIIFPAVLNVPIAYRSTYYVHLVLLHASLVLRIAGDLAVQPSVRTWGGLLNAITVVVFLGNTLRSVRRMASTQP